MQHQPKVTGTISASSVLKDNFAVDLKEYIHNFEIEESFYDLLATLLNFEEGKVYYSIKYIGSNKYFITFSSNILSPEISRFKYCFSIQENNVKNVQKFLATQN